MRLSAFSVALILAGALLLPTEVYAQPAAGACFERFDNTNRYFECGNGTVTDTTTGLIWLQQADCLGRADWAQANRVANLLADGQCNLTDASSPGDWRLPTEAEWRATIAKAVALHCVAERSPSLTNNSETGCLSAGPTFFTGVTAGGYWSSATGGATTSDSAWFGDLVNGGVFGSDKVVTLIVWPVRGGPR